MADTCACSGDLDYWAPDPRCKLHGGAILATAKDIVEDHGGDAVGAVVSVLERARRQDQRRKAENERLCGRIEALDALLACHRLGTPPSEALHRKLERTRAALASEGVHDG